LSEQPFLFVVTSHRDRHLNKVKMAIL